MKTLLIPACCLLLLGTMLSMVIGHWFQLVQPPAIAIQPPPQPEVPAKPAADSDSSTEPPIIQSNTALSAAPQSAAMPEQHRNHDLQPLLERIGRLETQNRTLRQQLAETNRDLLTLQFRVDTHSESFRPLPVAESDAAPVAIPIQETSPAPDPESEDDPVLLPARAEPVTQSPPE